MSPSVEVILKNVTSTIGEGPFWESSTNQLYYVDIKSCNVGRWDSKTGSNESIHLNGDTVGFIIPRTSGGYVCGVDRTLVHLDWHTHTTTKLHEVDAGTRNRFNDAKCDSRGNLWAGTMGFESSPAVVERGLGSLFRFGTDNSVSTATKSLDLSNGIAWTSDDRKMYFIDSVPRCIYSFDFDCSSGKLSNKQTLLSWAEKSMEEYGIPDGMSMDMHDKLWMASFGSGNIFHIDAHTGAVIQKIPIPAKYVTSCCFGGAQNDELYVTSSQYSYKTQEERNASDPHAGSIFRIKGMGAKGVPVGKFNG